jgi:hypothetical protein
MMIKIVAVYYVQDTRHGHGCIDIPGELLGQGQTPAE